MMRREDKLQVTLRRGYVRMYKQSSLLKILSCGFFFVASRKDWGSEAKVGDYPRNLVRYVLRISHSCIPLR